VAGASARGAERSAVNALIRPATVTDATAIGELAQEFQTYLRGLGDRTPFAFTAETYRRDGFGPTAAFAGLVAELEGQVVGYLLYHFGYDTDRALRLLYVIDLYVQEARRRCGVGEALMRAAAAKCQEAGGRELVWAVFAPNQLAFEFYERLGARYIQELKFMYWPVPGA
jgi:ribosomal protein S18 acetylase RimI-like enzyme